MDIAERWLPVPGYEGSYEVSDKGRVRSLDRLDTRGRRRNGKLLSPRRNPRSGHMSVALYRDDARGDFLVHRLVLEAFVGPAEPGMDGCHWNDVSTDNRLENLRWGTRSDNTLDSIRNGLHHLANKTHCPQGHEYTPENTYNHPAGRRACNECRRAYRESRRDERRAKGREYMRLRRARAKEATTNGKAA